MRARIALMAGFLATLAGCAVVALKHQAALDHGCPEDRIAVLRSPDDPGRPTEVNVCGTIRRYRIMSTSESGFPVWLDVTDLVRPSGGVGDGKR